jgi:hypothetical protein
VTAITNVSGSRGFSPKSIDLAACAEASASPMPMSMPMAVRMPASPRIMPMTLPRFAPMAIRTAISRCRVVARASNRLAILAQAMSSTIPASTLRMSSAGVNASRMGVNPAAAGASS